jgi:molecular chaperone DnaK (HSP70)
MQRIIYTCLLFVFCGSIQLSAQEPAGIVLEGMRTMSAGAENAFAISLPYADPKMVHKVWKHYVRSQFSTGTHYDRKEKEYWSESAKVKNITGFPINLVATADDFGSRIQFTLWIDMRGAYLSSETHPKKAEEVEYILHDFSVMLDRVKIEERLQEEERTLTRLERNLRKLEMANNRYNREIDYAEKRIEKMEANIVDNQDAQIATAEEIARQLEVVQEVKRQLMTVNQ